ncbi:hypothetical protein K7432_008677 [Basidiobolus ranarum]|uniref:Uncharacterized protein n=1 Tax=Basidiobolus ranarum TaxID=34480 RepID=A0ABR2WRF0_9FUNG
MRLFRQERVSKQRNFIPTSKHEMLAHEARDIMTGKRKHLNSGRTIKALQNPDTMNKVLPILRNLPETDSPHEINFLFAQEPSQPTSTIHLTIKEVRQRIELVNFSPLDAIATNQGPLLSNPSGPPPRDVVSVYTYWWGYEIYLPDELVKQLIKDGNTAVAAAGLIAALSAAVPALAPFVRVISAFLTLQIAAIQRKDRNSGIVLTSSWILPALLVPRQWK